MLEYENIPQIINEYRRKSNGKWYILSEWTLRNGKYVPVKVKGYHTWLQVLKIDNTNYPFPMDLSVKEFKDRLTGIFA